MSVAAKTDSKDLDLRELARHAVEKARSLGAKEAAAGATRQRQIGVTWRDGKVEKIEEATTRSLTMRLYVDGRFGGVSTSDLRPEALDAFLRNAIAMTRAVAVDPFRSLPDPSLYAGQAAIDLELEDPKHLQVEAVDRRRMAEAIEAAARQAPGAASILSVTSSVGDTWSEAHLVASNGFEGTRRDSAFFAGASVSVKDDDGRRPEDYHEVAGRRFAELPGAEIIGREASRRAVARRGARKGGSAELTVIVENRAAGRLASFMLMALSGQALQQKRSFFEGKLGAAIGSPLLDLHDDPLLPRGLGSRLFDFEGLAARRMPVFERGSLRNFYIDSYYAKKLKVAPTTGRQSNLAWRTGDKPLAALMAQAGEAILVTGFIGGNSNATTGDFSLGLTGVRVRGGKPAEPVAEMNIAGNHLELWKRLVAVGDDPWPYSTLRTPTLVFEKVQVAGT